MRRLCTHTHLLKDIIISNLGPVRVECLDLLFVHQRNSERVGGGEWECQGASRAERGIVIVVWRDGPIYFL